MTLKKIGKTLLLLFILSCSLSAAKVEFKAEVDKKTVPLNHKLTLTLTVDGTINVPGITLPDLEGFNILGQSSSTRLQMVNGNQFITKAFSYTLAPTVKGKHIIPSMSLKFGNRTYSTEPITVEVTDAVQTSQPAKQNRPNSSLFDFNHFTGAPPVNKVLVQMTTERKTIYVGEKSEIKIQAYFKRPFYDGPVFDFPELKGFIVKDQPGNNQPLKTSYKGEEFLVISAAKEITPVESGVYLLDPATVRYVENTFSGIKSEKTNSLKITVKPLPRPQPDDYSGAVGDFDLTAKVLQNKDHYLQGEPIPLSITISGRGNLDVVNSLELQGFYGFDTYLDTINEEKEGSSIKKSFKYQLIPLTVLGNTKLPVIDFVFFDPAKNSFVKKSSSLPIIEITKNNNLSFRSSLNDQEPITDNALIIRLDKGLLTKILKYFRQSLFFVLIALVVITFLYLIAKKFLSVKSSLKTKLKKLQKLQKGDYLQQANEILQLYSHRKHSIKLSGIATSQIPELIKEPGIAEKIISLMNLFEKYHYSTDKTLSEADKNMINDILTHLIKNY